MASYNPGYPRSETAHLRDGELLGKHEICALLEHTEHAWAKWRQFKRLPAADGPVVHGLPTWTRATLLAWAYKRGFTVHDNGTAMACHEEAARWAETVPAGDIVDWSKRTA
jgi:asparagine synthetase A